MLFNNLICTPVPHRVDGDAEQHGGPRQVRVDGIPENVEEVFPRLTASRVRRSRVRDRFGVFFF